MMRSRCDDGEGEMTSQTLEELEGEVWEEPVPSSCLIDSCHRLRRKPVDEFTAEDLRIMIGQEIALDHLMPRAVSMLEANPLVEGDLHPGDLLARVLKNAKWVKARPEIGSRMVVVAKRALEQLVRLPSEERASLEDLHHLLLKFVCR
jgi:hypothetical protein